jgi:hypothetical protein
LFWKFFLCPDAKAGKYLVVISTGSAVISHFNPTHPLVILFKNLYFIQYGAATTNISRVPARQKENRAFCEPQRESEIETLREL